MEKVGHCPLAFTIKGLNRSCGVILVLLIVEKKNKKIIIYMVNKLF